MGLMAMVGNELRERECGGGGGGMKGGQPLIWLMSDSNSDPTVNNRARS